MAQRFAILDINYTRIVRRFFKISHWQFDFDQVEVPVDGWHNLSDIENILRDRNGSTWNAERWHKYKEMAVDRLDEYRCFSDAEAKQVGLAVPGCCIHGRYIGFILKDGTRVTRFYVSQCPATDFDIGSSLRTKAQYKPETKKAMKKAYKAKKREQKRQAKAQAEAEASS